MIARLVDSSSAPRERAAPPAFAPELVLHLPRLRARARRLGVSTSEVEDLVQETFERALRFAHTFCPGTNLGAWLQQILVRVFLSQCRRRRRDRLALEELRADPCAWTQPDAAPVESKLSPRLETALATIPPAQKQVLCLVDLHELSYRDAATELDIPVGTVMSRLSRARHALAAELLDGERCAA